MNNLQDILLAIEQATDIAPEPFSSKSIMSLPSISYIAYRQGDNGVVESWRFQVRVCADDMATAVDLEETIADTLVTLGAEEKLNALSIEINGGGTIEDERTGLPQLITYYNINTKS